MTELLTSPIGIGLTVGVVVGLALLVRGLRGRRVGDTPYCRKCSYNLTGLTGEQCPECGHSAKVGDVVRGVRRRRRPSLVVGLGMLLVSGTGLGSWAYCTAKRINVYPYLPTSVLVHQARQDTPQACSELIKRGINKRLSGQQAQRIAELALSKSVSAKRGRFYRAWIDLLAVLYRNGDLTSRQSQELYRHFLVTELRVRARIRQGDPLVSEFRCYMYVPNLLALESQAVLQGVGIDGELLFHPRELGIWQETVSSGGDGFLWADPVLTPSDDLEPGVHAIEYLLHQTASYAYDDQPFWAADFVVSATVEVISSNQQDPIRLVRDPTLAPGIEGNISAHCAYEASETGHGFLTVRLELARLPSVTLSFDVTLLGRDKEQLIGSAVWPTGGQTLRSLMSPLRPQTQPDPWQVEAELSGVSAPQFSLVLRPSREGVVDTLDCFEIWGREVRFGPVAFEDMLHRWDPDTHWIPAARVPPQ